MDVGLGSHRRLGFLIDLMAIVVGFVIADEALQVVTGRVTIDNEVVYLQTFLFCIISWTVSILLSARYTDPRNYTFMLEAGRALRVNSVALLIFGFMAFVFKMPSFSRLFTICEFISVFCLMLFFRICLKVISNMLHRSGRDVKSRIIVGTGSAARAYIEESNRHRHHGIQFIGCIAPDNATGTLPLPHLGPIDEIDDILSRYPVEGVVITLNVSDPSFEKVVRACDIQGVAVELALDGLWSRIATSEIVHGIGGSRLVLAAIPHSSSALFWKRLTDIVVSTIALILALPILVSVALAIKLDDGGPIIFSQERVGQHKKAFRMHKFRSMRTDAEKIRESLLHLNEMSGPVFKLTNDPRVTRVGKFLRKTSLDELPQLWNVLVGDMSLVGPRPPLPSEVREYEHEQRRRLSVKPGLTCLWQISGRNEIDFDEWMQLDLQYIDNWSYYEDLRILLMTVPAVLKRQGAS